MTGLEKLTDSILSNAEERCRQQLSLCREQCSALLEEADTAALKGYDEIILKAKKEAALKRENEINSIKRKHRNLILETKTNAVNEAISAAEGTIINSDEIYNRIFEVFLKGCELKCGRIFLNSRDLKRLSKPCRKLLDSYDISTDDTLTGGFYVVFDKLTENYSLDLVFESEKENLTDLLSSMLFI